MELNNYLKDLFVPDLSQEDPIIQYYIVNSDLEMSAGKASAQCSHGSSMFTLAWEKFNEDIPQLKENSETIKEWFMTSFRKVVLKASKKEFDKCKELPHFLVTDAGLTEVDSGSETVLCLLPMKKSLAPKIIRKLRLL